MSTALVEAFRIAAAESVPQGPHAEIDEVEAADDLEPEERRLGRAEQRGQADTRCSRPHEQTERYPDTGRDPAPASATERVPSDKNHVGAGRDDQQRRDREEAAEIHAHGEKLSSARCRCKTASRRSASSSQTRRAGSSTATAAACTTRTVASAAATTAGAGSRAGSSSGLAPGSAPATGSLHRALLPRRGDCFAAGHRPCAYAAARTTTASTICAASPGTVGADAIDVQLHGDAWTRARGRSAATRQRSTSFPTARSSLTRASRGSCSAASSCAGPRPATRARGCGPRGRAIVLTPPTLVAVLRTGWQPVVPLLHPSA